MNTGAAGRLINSYLSFRVANLRVEVAAGIAFSLHISFAPLLFVFFFPRDCPYIFFLLFFCNASLCRNPFFPLFFLLICSPYDFSFALARSYFFISCFFVSSLLAHFGANSVSFTFFPFFKREIKIPP